MQGRHWFIAIDGPKLSLHKHRPSRWLPRGKGSFSLGFGRWKYDLTYSHGRGIWVTSRGGWAPEDRLRDSRTLTWEKPNMRKRQATPATGTQKHLAAVETSYFKDIMPLVEHCCFRQYDDGDAREPGWITIKTMGAAWCIQVKDPDSATSFTAIADSIDKALETAALLLAADEAPWETDAFLAAAKARKKK